MLCRKILQRKFFLRNLVHRTATVPTLYVSNSFHQYKGAVIRTYTGIILIYFRCSVPALERHCIRSKSFEPISIFSRLYKSGSVLLSLFSYEFIGFLIPSIINSICSGLAKTTFVNLMLSHNTLPIRYLQFC